MRAFPYESSISQISVFWDTSVGWRGMKSFLVDLYFSLWLSTQPDELDLLNAVSHQTQHLSKSIGMEDTEME